MRKQGSKRLYNYQAQACLLRFKDLVKNFCFYQHIYFVKIYLNWQKILSRFELVSGDVTLITKQDAHLLSAQAEKNRVCM